MKFEWFTLRDLVGALFPKGNSRYYFMYLFFIITISAMSYATVSLMGILDNGNTISTDYSVTHMDYPTSHAIPEWVYPIITNLLSVYGYVMLILIVHTGISLLFDIGYKIHDCLVWAGVLMGENNAV